MNSVHPSADQTFFGSFGGTQYPFHGNMELQTGSEDLLDDIESLLDMRNIAFDYADTDAFPLTGAASEQSTMQSGHQHILGYGQNQFHHYGNTNYTNTARQQHLASPEGTMASSEDKDMSKYALNAIFKNLIYPDVCQGHFMTFDSLVQTVPLESHQNHSKKKDIRKDTFNCDQRSLHQQVKRKRSRDVSCDEDYLKRRRY